MPTFPLKAEFPANFWENDEQSVDGDQFIRPDLLDGTCAWMKATDGRIVSLYFVCPCGCKRLGALSLDGQYGRPVWHWDGNATSPTLTPSVQKTSPCRWHGWLRNGEWVLA